MNDFGDTSPALTYVSYDVALELMLIVLILSVLAHYIIKSPAPFRNLSTELALHCKSD